MTHCRGSHVLITGAASGIGQLMALGALRRGAKVTLLDRDADGLEKVREVLGGETAAYVVDLADRARIRTVAAEILKDRGPVTILINNAGIVTGKPLLECSDEAIELTFKVNTLALFWMTRAFLPAMVKQGKGHIVTVASAAGLAGVSRLTDYCSSKFAAVGFDESLRLECRRLGLPVRTTVVCPFYIDTGMFQGVKTRFSWLLPILDPAYVTRRILDAIEGNRRRLILPRFVLAVLMVKALPPPLFDAITGFFGVNRCMDDFVGRG
jgi:all-trans-retinol dehydrogenase (NAD+)